MTAPRLDRIRSRELWSKARDFDELCSLGARFSAGTIAHFPGWGASALDVESDAIQDELVLLARAGWLTTCSQPGLEDAARELRQRAFVCGFASEALAQRLAELDGRASLRVRAVHGASAGFGEVAVTMERGLARVVLGGPAFEAELECFAADLRPEVLAELARRPYVCAWDEDWGPSVQLWNALRELLRPDGRF
ncbi:MAG: hypothetical protein HZA53_07775 [Planctomycetes bacterium]|nr:hypothetical protein [Planctomycetota bacterium]